jgi:hypothetical protein
VLRLKKDALSFVARKDTEKSGVEGLSEWYLQELAKFPVTDLDKPQPNLGEEEVARLVAGGARRMVEFLTTLAQKWEEGLRGDS